MKLRVLLDGLTADGVVYQAGQEVESPGTQLAALLGQIHPAVGTLVVESVQDPDESQKIARRRR